MVSTFTDNSNKYDHEYIWGLYNRNVTGEFIIYHIFVGYYSRLNWKLIGNPTV